MAKNSFPQSNFLIFNFFVYNYSIMSKQYSKSFTLIELLVVLALIAILVAILVVILKPETFFAKARDTKRIGDLKNIEKMIEILRTTEFSFKELKYASSNVVYISLPDTSATCTNWLSQLPPLPSGWSYACSATPTNVDGTGWIPIPFSQFPILNVTELFIDPINEPPYYYTFVAGGSYKLTAKLEVNQLAAINDGGIEPLIYEAGNDKRLPTPQSGLVGYWSFDEGQGTIAYDLSGYGNNGILYNFNGTATSGWTTGKVGGALIFDGSNDYVQIMDNPPLRSWPNGVTVAAWVRSNTDLWNSWGMLVSKRNSFILHPNGNSKSICWYIYDNTNWRCLYYNIPYDIKEWHFYVGTYSENNYLRLYIDGNLAAGPLGPYGTIASSTGGFTLYIGQDAGRYFNGLIDEVRLYNRALSDSEIKVLYEATK
jgi:prepilin-type N-terminal cleavage/methylation domain-containing protein